MSTSLARQLVTFQEEVRSAIAGLQAQIHALANQPAQRDQHDRHLRRALCSGTHGLPFTVTQLLEHAREVPELGPALAAATLQTPHEIGCWLRKHQGVRDGITIERLPRRRWRAVHIDMYVSDSKNLPR